MITAFVAGGLCLLATEVAITSCSTIYTDMSDCPTGLSLHFRYDYNMSYVNALHKNNDCLTVCVYDSEGNMIVYTITEDKVPGYTTKIDGYNIINTYVPETVNISGKKTWNDDDNKEGLRPEEITIYLYANGERVAVKRETFADLCTLDA